MILLLILLSLTYSSFHFRVSVIDFLSPLSYFFHQRCLYLLPSSVLEFPEMAALVCGHNFEKSTDSQLYKSAGLIHLFVVSGSHLILLKNILEKGPFSRPLILGFLVLYCFCSELNPPVVRSCLFIFLVLYLKIHLRLWPSHYVLLISGLLCLSLNPYWAASLSLQMSWIAGLILICCSSLNPLLRHLTFYTIFGLTYLGLGFPSPAIIPLSFFVSPILEFILFPLCLAATFIHFLEPFPKLVIQELNTVLIQLEFRSNPLPSDPSSISNVVLWNWVLICFLHTYLYLRKKTK